MRKFSDVNLKAIQHVRKGASARAALKQWRSWARGLGGSPQLASWSAPSWLYPSPMARSWSTCALPFSGFKTEHSLALRRSTLYLCAGLGSEPIFCGVWKYIFSVWDWGEPHLQSTAGSIFTGAGSLMGRLFNTTHQHFSSKLHLASRAFVSSSSLAPDTLSLNPQPHYPCWPVIMQSHKHELSKASMLWIPNISSSSSI